MNQKEDHHNSGASVIGALLLGLAAGVALGFILAQAKGSETRQRLYSCQEEQREGCGKTVPGNETDDPEADRPV